MKKKKLTAWLLAVAMTLGSVNPVFASEAELFTDGGTETVQMQEEEALEDETEENEEIRQSQAEIFTADPEETGETVLFSDGTGDGQTIMDPATDGAKDETVIKQPGQYSINTISDGSESIAEFSFSPTDSGYYYIGSTAYGSFSCAYTADDQVFTGEPLVFWAESGQTYSIDTTTDDAGLSTIIINVKNVSKESALGSDGSITLTPDGGEAVFLFAPTEDGVYSFDAPESIFNNDGYYFSELLIKYSENFYYNYSLTSKEESISFNKGEYWIVVKNIKADAGPFEIKSNKRSLITSVEITDGLEIVQRDWIYGCVDYDFGLDVLTLKATFDDGQSVENIKAGETFYHNDAGYLIDTSILQEPSSSGGDGELSPGEYQIGFSVFGSGEEEPAKMPEPITMTVKKTNEFTEFPVLEFGRTYSLNEFEKNYWNDTKYAFQIRPEETGIHNLSELESNAYANGYDLLIINKDGNMPYYDFGNAELNGGETYFIILSGGNGDFTFSLPMDSPKPQEINGEGEVALISDSNHSAYFLFKPEESGVYEFIVPEDISREGISLSVFDGDFTEGTHINADDSFSRFFSSGKVYTVTLEELPENAGTFTLFSKRIPRITSLEITDGLNRIQTEWVYGCANFTFGLDVLNLKAEFDDGTIMENLKVRTPFSHNGEEYTISTRLIERPETNNEEECGPGEYKIGFGVIGKGYAELEREPAPISMSVKRTSEFSATDFPVLEFGQTYSLNEFEKNYWNGTRYVFQLKPEKTGIYDLSEFVSKAWENNYDVSIISEGGQTDGFVANTFGMNGGETYFIILYGEGESFDFAISSVSQIQSFEIVNPGLLSGVQIISEFADEYALTYLLQELRFEVTYTYAEGNTVTDIVGLNDYNDAVGSIRVSYDEVDWNDPSTQAGKKEVRFYPDGMESLKRSIEVEFSTLDNVIGNLPEISADGTEVNVPVNYNLGKCFTFTAPEDGIYIFDFGVNAAAFYICEEDIYHLEEAYDDKVRLDAAEGMRYVFCVTSNPYDEEGEIAGISANKYDAVEKIEIVSDIDEPIKWGHYLGTPESLKNIIFRYTLTNGETKEIRYGDEIPGYGKIGLSYSIDGENLGEFQMRFCFEYAKDVSTEPVWFSCVPISELDLPELELDQNISVKKESSDFWVTTFTPEKDSTYTIQFSQPVSDGLVYEEEADGEDGGYTEYISGQSVTVELKAGKFYVFRFSCEEEEAEIAAKIFDNNVSTLSLDTRELTLVPGQTGTITAIIDPASATENINWSIEPENSGFTLEVLEDTRKAKIKAPEDISDISDTQQSITVKARTEETGLEAGCTVKIGQIAAEVPKINSSQGAQQEGPLVGLNTSGTTESGETSDAEKAEQNLNEIVSAVSSEGGGADDVEFEPAEESGNVKEEITETLSKGGSVVTEVIVNNVTQPGDEEEESVIEAVEDVLTQEDTELNVEQKLDISIEISKVSNSESYEWKKKIGNISALPNDKKITFTVLLTEEQSSKKMYVAYEHNGIVSMIPEADTTQKDGILTFKAQKFSSYYLVSRGGELVVTFKNTSPSGGSYTQEVAYGGTVADPDVTEPSNYIFNGWIVEGTDEKWDFNKEVTTDLTLIGSWTYDPPSPPSVTYYTIRFDSQGGSSVSSQALTYGSKVREPQAPTRDGYTFAGWYKESSCTNPWDFAKDTVTSSHTLYAKWEEISQTPEVPAVSEIISRKGYLEVKLGAAITGADGYEYAYSTAGGDWTTAEDYTVLGETKELSYTSTKVPAGIYVVRVRAYKESAEGKRYGAWSEEQWTELPTGTLDAPEILSVKVQGRTVTVKIKGPAGAEGYDAVMGVTGNPIKPTPYSYVIKNQKTTTLVFENVADGAYYIGVHAYRKENGVKTFSKWSAQKQAEVAAGDLPEAEAPDTPTIIGHYAKKGYLKVRIAEGAEGKQGYEYAYSTKGGAWTSPEDYTLFGRTPLLYRATTKIPAGVYAVKVRAFIRVNGERIYSSWSQPEWVELPTGTLKAPKIKNVKVNGNTVTLTLTGVKGAAGYDAVLGRSHNPAKPTAYAYVKKNQRTVTITFRNVKAGTYYIGAHAYAKEAGKKVFSKWSGQKRIVVK